MYVVTLASSLTGVVFGMHATAVNPPATADAVPVATVSLCSCPGSRRGTCISMNPRQPPNPWGTSKPAAPRATAFAENVATAVGPVGGIDGQVRADARDAIGVDQHVAHAVDPVGGI